MLLIHTHSASTREDISEDGDGAGGYREGGGQTGARGGGGGRDDFDLPVMFSLFQGVNSHILVD